jgi:Protein of unknown function (DUF664)
MGSGDHRPEPRLSGPPVQLVSEFLDFLRATLLWKLEGLSDEQLRRPGTASGVSLIGMLKHSAAVEVWWFQIEFAGREVPRPWSDSDPEADWRVGPNDRCESIIELYKAECQRSREIVAGANWDDLAKNPREGAKGRSLGWILTHMVEEVARHCGHADILREAIDGATGE